MVLGGFNFKDDSVRCVAYVYVNELAKVLRPLADVRVHAFGGPREPGTEGADPGVTGYPEVAELEGANAALKTFGVDLEMVPGVEGADIVHSHTWYANLAGHLSGMLYGIPHILSAHSLEPMRPWKAEQLGGGYALSSWAERQAYEGATVVIAVSQSVIIFFNYSRHFSENHSHPACVHRNAHTYGIHAPENFLAGVRKEISLRAFGAE